MSDKGALHNILLLVTVVRGGQATVYTFIVMTYSKEVIFPVSRLNVYISYGFNSSLSCAALNIALSNTLYVFLRLDTRSIICSREEGEKII